MSKTKTSLGVVSKLILLFINVLALLCGIACVTLGIWNLADKKSFESLTGSDLFSLGAYIIIVVGFIVIILSFIGCFGAVKEVKCLLIIYFAVILLMFLMSTIAGVLTYVFNKQLQEYLLKNMVRSMKMDYANGNKLITDSWDYTQSKFHCCAVGNRENETNFVHWEKTTWYHNSKLAPREKVPKSCCADCASLYKNKVIRNDICKDPSVIADKLTRHLKTDLCKACPKASAGEYPDPSWCQGTSPQSVRIGWPYPDVAYTKGCYNTLLHELRTSSVMLIGISFAAASLMVFAMVFSLCLYRDI